MEGRWSARRVGGATALLLCLLCLGPDGSATSVVVDPPPRICDITAELVGANEVVIRWRSGTPPFLVLRGDREDFTAAEVRLLASDVTARQFRDRVDTRKRSWYQVMDLNSPPLLLGTDPPDPHVGDVLTIQGVGFATKCADNHVIQAGKLDAMPIRQCSLTSLEIEVPIHALSDEIMVMTPRGLGRFGSELQDGEGIPRGPVTWASPEGGP